MLHLSHYLPSQKLKRVHHSFYILLATKKIKLLHWSHFCHTVPHVWKGGSFPYIFFLFQADYRRWVFVNILLLTIISKQEQRNNETNLWLSLVVKWQHWCCHRSSNARSSQGFTATLYSFCLILYCTVVIMYLVNNFRKSTNNFNQHLTILIFLARNSYIVLVSCNRKKLKRLSNSSYLKGWAISISFIPFLFQADYRRWSFVTIVTNTHISKQELRNNETNSWLLLHGSKVAILLLSLKQ
jgi:hypothetical protein